MIATLADRVAVLEAERQPNRLQPRPADAALFDALAEVTPEGHAFTAADVIDWGRASAALRRVISAVAGKKPGLGQTRRLGIALGRLGGHVRGGVSLTALSKAENSRRWAFEVAQGV